MTQNIRTLTAKLATFILKIEFVRSEKQHVVVIEIVTLIL